MTSARVAAWTWWAALVASACEGPAPLPEDNEITVVVQADKSRTQMEERILRAKREELERERIRIQDEIAKMRAMAEKSTRPPDYQARLQDLEGKAAELLAREQALEKERSRLAAEAGISADPIPAALVGGGSLAVREEEMAKREGALAEREQQIAARELDLARRERELAAREDKIAKDQRSLFASGLSGGTPLPPMPIGGVIGASAPAPARGGAGSAAAAPSGPMLPAPAAAPTNAGAGNRVAVEAWHEKVLNDMLAKGILWSDLSSTAQGLNNDIWAARRANDWNKAGELVAQLIAAVDVVKVDGNFIQEKIKRVTATRTLERLDAGRKVQVDRLLREVELKFGDGRFQEANRDINRIVQLLEAGS